MCKVNQNEKTKNNEKDYKKSLIIRKILFMCFLIIFIFSVVNLIISAIYNKKTDKLLSNIIKENFTQDNKDSNKNPINFENLHKINSDIIAWIRIKNTNINYPVFQTADNEHYLRRDINKEYNAYGSIFMNYNNSKAFIDKNTVLFGSNIRKDFMFDDLKKILNNELGNKIIVEIYTPQKKIDYIVFSTYTNQTEQYSINPNIVEDDELAEYIKELLNRSSILYNIVPNKKDKLLTLSTYDRSEKNRILVHAVYLNEEIYK